MPELEPTIAECLCPRVARAEAFQRYHEVAGQNDATVFAVFDENDRYLGLVTDRQAALFPTRIFADLLLRRQPPPIPEDTPVTQVLQRIEQEKEECIAVADHDGHFLGAVSQLSIVEALVARERRLREQVENLLIEYKRELDNRQIATAVFNTTSDGILVTDADQRILLVNRAFCETTGWAADDIIGQKPDVLRSNQHDNAFYRQMWENLGRDGSWEGEIWNRHRNGEIYPEWLHINAIRDDQDQIRYYAGVFSDTTRHKEIRARLHHLAYHDSLTDLPNRQQILDSLALGVAKERRDGGGLALLFVDLDGFKEVNDTLGHLIGDRLLTRVGQHLRESVRDSDIVGRLGGDEFVVIVSTGPSGDNTIEILTTIAQKLIAALNRPFMIDGNRLFVSASIGISRYPDDGETPDALLMAADNAMYEAKRNGFGSFSFYSASGHSRFVEKVHLTAELRQALADKQLSLVWQPQIDMNSNRIVGMEALARWRRADGSHVPPDLFISLAEQSGLISQLGEQVLRMAASQIAEMTRQCTQPLDGLRFAINLSPFQIRPTPDDTSHASSANAILSILAQHDISPSMIELELTETAIATHRDGIGELLQRLGDADIQLAIDDFGTGCSNLATIKQLPIHKLKIDRSLVMDLVTDSTDREIAAAVIGMARALGLKIVAEGVETEEQADLLRELGCHLAQGYLYSRPVPLHELKPLLAQQFGATCNETI